MAAAAVAAAPGPAKRGERCEMGRLPSQPGGHLQQLLKTTTGSSGNIGTLDCLLQKNIGDSSVDKQQNVIALKDLFRSKELEPDWNK
ncbi:hypothetical protein TREES_T100001786 [Tupaia chinensis]|uniref:Uncharacterized protein n=1 Tax=Tupaia chinensis TaxID=246437 RepID=L9KJW7_TUPCH|nr:hypothetical protein TREES_T100001786 [Tupaia chinensis]